MSAARAGDSTPAEPLDLTDAEVAALARGEGRAAARRIAGRRPAKPVGRLETGKPAPPRLSTPEMERIRRASGRVPAGVRERLERAGEEEAASKSRRPRRPEPAEKPPRGS